MHRLVYQRPPYQQQLWYILEETDYQICPNSGNNPPHGNGPTTPPAKPKTEPIPIIYEDSLDKNPCAKLAWELLRNNYTFNSIISKFLGKNSAVNIHLQVVTNLKDRYGNSCDGLISPLMDNTYFISINDSFASHASTMEVARVFLHEIIHAELNYYFTVKCKGNLATFQSCYPDLYTRWQAYGFYYKEDYQHGEMTNYYRTTMKDMLKTIYPGLSDSMYDAAIWGGLMDTRAWVLLPLNEQIRIKSIISDIRNLSDGNCLK